jgi:hypothetical protein
MVDCFLRVVFLKIAEMAQIFGLLCSTVNVTYHFGQNLSWATFWAIFSQTHLATLVLTIIIAK